MQHVYKASQLCLNNVNWKRFPANCKFCFSFLILCLQIGYHHQYLGRIVWISNILLNCLCRHIFVNIYWVGTFRGIIKNIWGTPLWSVEAPLFRLYCIRAFTAFNLFLWCKIYCTHVKRQFWDSLGTPCTISHKPSWPRPDNALVALTIL